MGVVENGSPYTFSVKPKWQTVVSCFFVMRSSAEGYLHTSPPRGHSTVGVPKCCEGFVVIWLRAREEFADNRFQLLFIYIDNIHYITCSILYLLSFFSWAVLSYNRQAVTTSSQTLLHIPFVYLKSKCDFSSLSF